jgi:WD40 repeat protein/predicted Ser/Thr protein kinase
MDRPPTGAAQLPSPVALAADYQRQWRPGPASALRAFVQCQGALTGEHLLELVRVDMIEWARAGVPAPVETYLRDFPPLGTRTEWVLELLDAEVCCARRWGAPPTLEDYLRRFPTFAAALHDLFAVDAMDLSSATGGGALADRDCRRGATAVAADDDTVVPPPAATASGYELLEEIGRGGMGVVYRARQLGLNRIVAVKTLRGDATAGRDRRRFQAEAEAVAPLKHPNIVPIYEVGEMAGQPFFAMEFIEGGSLRERVKRGPLPVAEAVELGETVAAAVHYAHQRGILHRDLKPANVLVDAAGRPRLVDFGLARRLEEGAGLSLPGNPIGTPEFMPPEQARGDSAAVGVPSDVYALGALLYALVTGRPPFTGGHAVEIIRRVLDEEPVPPRQRNPQVAPDLDAIILKCLEKEPARRYPAAAEVAAELRRFRRGEPIAARPIGRGERLRRWCRRKPWQAAVAALAGLAILLVLVLGVTSSLAAAEQRRLRVAMEQERNEAQQMRRRAEAHQTRLQHTLAALYLRDSRCSEAEAELGLIPAGAASFDTHHLNFLAQFHPTQTKILCDGHWGVLALALHPDRRRLIAADAAGAVVVWDAAEDRMVQRLTAARIATPPAETLAPPQPLHYLAGRGDGRPMSQWEPCCTDLAWVGESDRAVGASLNGQGLLFDIAAGNAQTICTADEPLYAVAVSTDGSRALFGGARGGLYLRALAGQVSRERRHGSRAITAIAFSRRAGLWLVGDESGQLAALAADTLEPQFTRHAPGPIWALDLSESADPPLAAVAGQMNGVLVCGIHAGERRFSERRTLTLPPAAADRLAAHAVCFAADGKAAYAVDSQRRLVKWDVASGAVETSVACIVRDRRSEAIAQPLAEGPTPRELPLPMQRTAGRIVAGGQHNEELIVAGADAALKWWRFAPQGKRRAKQLAPRTGPNPQIGFAAHEAGVLWALDAPGTLWAFDTRANRVLTQTKAHDGGTALVVAGDGLVVTAGRDGRVKFWRREGGQARPAHLKSLAHDQPIRALAVDAERHWLAAVDDCARLCVWDFAAGRQRHLCALSPSGDRPLTGRLAFNRDGTRLCAFGSGQAAVIFETSAFHVLPEQARVAGSGGTALVWNPLKSDALLVADSMGRYAPMHWSDGDHCYPRSAISHAVALRCTADGRRIVALEQDGQVRFFEPEGLVQLHDARAAGGKFCDLAFDAACRRLALASDDGTLEIWDTELPEAPAAAQAGLTVTDDRARWSEHVLVEPTPRIIYLPPRAMAVDRQSRPCALYTACEPGSQGVGPLRFVRAEGQRLCDERLEAGGAGPADAAADRRVEPEAFCLALQGNGEPWAVYRRRTEIASPYDGQLLLAQRRAAGDWRYETVVAGGNLGFTPAVIQDRRGDIQEIYHYSFAGLNLVRSVRRADGGWQSAGFGTQGFGLRLAMLPGTRGDLHFVATSHRFNCDPRPAMYGHWDGTKWREEIIDPTGGVLPSLALLPDGTPVAERPGVLLRRAGERWVEFCRLPGEVGPTAARCVIAPNGDIYAAAWDAPRRAILLFRRHENQWQGAIVAQPAADREPNLLCVCLDPRGRPAIFFGLVGEPYGWLAAAQARRE